MSATAVKRNLKIDFCVGESINGYNRVAQLYTILIPSFRIVHHIYMSSICDV